MDGKRSGNRPPRGGETPDTNANVRASGVIMVIAFVLMALLNSSDMRSYARDLPDNWFTDKLVVGADQWHEMMMAYGPAHVRPAVHGLVESARELQW